MSMNIFFLQISKQDDHEFYELVNTYFKGRNTLALAIKEYEVCLSWLLSMHLYINFIASIYVEPVYHGI